MTRAEILQTAKPILFNTEMVRAILNNEKSVTRRILKPQPYKESKLLTNNLFPETVEAGAGNVYAFWDGTVTTPTYKVGDILYVRETWRKWVGGYSYKADAPNTCQWKPSIHMPKEAARIFLWVTDVRVERLQDIRAVDCISEGVVSKPHYTKRGNLVLHGRYKTDFSLFWNSTVKKSDLDKYGWDANPWVWVIEFERVEVTE